MANLERPGSVWLLEAQVDLTCDGQPHEEPVAEAVVVDELEDVLHCQVDQGHDTLPGIRTQTHTQTGRHKQLLV